MTVIATLKPTSPRVTAARAIAGQVPDVYVYGYAWSNRWWMKTRISEALVTAPVNWLMRNGLATVPAPATPADRVYPTLTDTGREWLAASTPGEEQC